MSLAVARRQQAVILSGDESRVVPGIAKSSLSDAEVASLTRLVDLPYDRKDQLLVKPKPRLLIGSVALRDQVISVAPPLQPSLFVTMLVTSISPEFLGKKFAREAETSMAVDVEGDPRYFETLLAVLCVAWTERILSTHIAQAYVRRSERLKTLKGRVTWSRNFGHHPVEGLHCRYFVKETDNLLNRLVLAALKKCEIVLRNTEWAARVKTQVFMWRSLASSHVPKRVDFKVAESKMTRQTEHYRPALRLGHALLYGHAPSALTPEGSEWLQGMYLHMDRIYEDFLFELLRNALAGSALNVRKQVSQRDAFTNALGNRYMQARPDIVIFRDGAPVAVMDAKYKPKYMRGGPGAPTSLEYRVSSADLYQMFFYEARLRYKYSLPQPLETAIVAPQFDTDIPVAPPYRVITANAADQSEAARLHVIPLPLEAVLGHVKEGRFSDAFREAGELQEFVRGLADNGPMYSAS